MFFQPSSYNPYLAYAVIDEIAIAQIDSPNAMQWEPAWVVHMNGLTFEFNASYSKATVFSRVAYLYNHVFHGQVKSLSEVTYTYGVA